MVATRHHHDIMVFNCACFVDAAVVGIDPLKCETLGRIQAVVVRFFQQGFFGRHVAVVLVRRVAARMACWRDHFDHQQVVSTRIVLGEDVAHIARVGAFSAHAAAHGGPVDAAHGMPPLARRTAQRDLCIACGCDGQRLAAGHVQRVRRLLGEHAVARTQPREHGVADPHFDGAGEHDQTQLARASVKRFVVARSQPQGTETHMRPAGPLGRDLADFSPGGGLDEQAHGVQLPSRLTMARSVSWPFLA